MVIREILKLLKNLMLILAIAYVVLTIYTVVFDFLLVLKTFFDLTGINSDYFLTDQSQGNEDLSNWFFDSVYYNTMYILSLISSILGMLILTRRRSAIQAMALLLGFIIPPERKSWGRIIDSSTAKPVPFASIFLEPQNGQRKVIKTIADSDGRYKLVIPDKKYNYEMFVRAVGYKDLKKEIQVNSTLIYGNEYINDIFIHQIGKNRKGIFTSFSYLSWRFYWYLVVFIFCMSVFSLISSIYYVYAYPGSLFGALNLALFVFSVAWNIVMLRERLKPKIGRVLDVRTRKPVRNVRVYIYKDDKQLENLETNLAGIVNSNLDPGFYEVRLAKEGYKTASKETFQKVRFKNDGYFEGNLFVEEVDLNDTDKKEANPFA